MKLPYKMKEKLIKFLFLFIVMIIIVNIFNYLYLKKIEESNNESYIITYELDENGYKKVK